MHKLNKRTIPFTKVQKSIIQFLAFCPILISATFVDLTAVGKNLPDWFKALLCFGSLFGGTIAALSYIEYRNRIEREILSMKKD